MCKGLILLLLLPACFAKAQILPVEGARLNYRIIGFSWPGANDKDYTIEIARGNYNDADSFDRHIIISDKSSTNRLIEKVPSFGSSYTWRVAGNKKNHNGDLHHFSTDIIPNADTSHMRLRVTKQGSKYKDAYVFVDGSGVLYDMNGAPVWFLPEKRDFPPEAELRDLKLSPFGTITLMKGNIYEIDCNGNILWQGPDLNEQYHHQFTRLANGHYAVLGIEFCTWDRTRKDSLVLLHAAPQRGRGTAYDTIYRSARFGTIIEYDAKGNKVWEWHSMDYFNRSDIFYHQYPGEDITVVTHDNAFYYDERDSSYYLSYKYLNRVIKIKYPEGKVTEVYGNLYQKGKYGESEYLFCRQHCCMVAQNGDLYLFNNNDCHINSGPTVVVMQQPKNSGDTLQKVWEYACGPECEDTAVLRQGVSTGGAVMQLPDKSMFIETGFEYSKLLIVNTDKEVLWSALPEARDERTGEWKNMRCYRASIILDKKDIERLVWGVGSGSHKDDE